MIIATHESQEMEIMEVPINWQMDQENMALIYNGILVGHKKE
jgi:hypothetical protein